MYERFSDRARKVMQLANQEAIRFRHQYIGTEHILLGLIAEQSGVATNVLRNLDVDLVRVRKEVEKIVQAGPEPVQHGKLPQTPRAKKVVEYAIEEAQKLQHNYVGTEHLLLGLLREEEGVAAQILMNLGLRLDTVRETVLNVLGYGDSPSTDAAKPRTEAKGTSKTPLLDAFGRDLTELAHQARLEPVIGRHAQRHALIEVLGCRQRNSAVLVGAMGVGKTTIIHGLAQAIAQRNVPDTLENCRIVEFSFGRVRSTACEAAGIEWARAALGEIKRSGDVILYLPNELRFLSTPVPSSIQQAGVEAEWLDALRRGELRCILVGSPHDYQSCVGVHMTLERACQLIQVPPATVDETLAILGGLRNRYEDHHVVRFTDDALSAAADLADRRLPGALPGKALLLLDHAGARGHGRGADASRELRQANVRLQKDIERLTVDMEAAVAQQAFDHAAELRDRADRLRKERDKLLKEEQRLRQEHGTIDAAEVAETLHALIGDSQPPTASADAPAGK
jgi:ATP-dependent Clp protease ATP-binding subunit ClpC